MSDKSPGHWCGKGVAEESQGKEQRGEHSPALVSCPIQQAPRGPFASNPLVSDKETGSGRLGQVTMLSAIQGHSSEDVPPCVPSLGKQPVGWQENATVVGVARCHWSIQETQRGCHTGPWQRAGQGQLLFLTIPTVRGWTNPPALPLITS